jgi:hypothetical protein
VCRTWPLKTEEEHKLGEIEKGMLGRNEDEESRLMRNLIMYTLHLIFYLENLKGNNHLGDVGVDKIILKRIMKKSSARVLTFHGGKER